MFWISSLEEIYFKRDKKNEYRAIGNIQYAIIQEFRELK